MARPKQELFRLLERMSEKELERLAEELVEPRVRELREERLNLQVRLQDVERKLARLESKGKGGRGRARKPAIDLRRKIATRRRPARRRRGRGGRETFAGAIERILRSADKPMRVKDICDALVREGQSRTAGLPSYVSRVLATNDQFVKADWGEYKFDKRKTAKSARKGAGTAGRKGRTKGATKTGRKKKRALKRKAKALTKR
jgi:hypothetical protein